MSAPERKRERTHTQTSNSIRSKLNDQLTKLQVKHNAEVEFLEDMRTFTKQRSAIEKEYAQNLQRLTQQYLSKREIKSPPEVNGYDRTENRGLLEIWKMMLEKTEEISKHRMRVADMMLSSISEEMRQQKRVKEQVFKKCFEVAQKMNSEILESVKEMTVAKKTYNDLEKVCADARQKFSESEQRLRKKDLKFFESLSSLEKSHRKSSDRLKSCQKRTTVGRNDYLLAIETTNAHLKRHGRHDLPQLMQVMDGELYEKARDAYIKYAQIEVDSATLVRADMEDLREQAYLVNREYVLECFLHKYPVIKGIVVYEYEPYGQDQVRGLSREHGAEIFLDKDARKLASKLTKDHTSIAARQKQIKGLQSVTTAYTKNPEFGTSDAQAEAQQNIESLREEIRQFEVQTTKTEARLEALRGVGIDVSKWLQKAEDKSGSQDLLSVGASNRHSMLSLNSGSQEFEWGDTGSLRDDIMSVTSEAPKHCVVLYSYMAQRPDELDIHTDDELEVLEWDDGDGWCKGKNKAGKEGFFPQSYVQPSSRSPSPHTVLGQQQTSLSGNSNQCNGNVTMLCAVYEYTAQFEEELSFPEGAKIELIRMDDNGVDDGWWEGRYEGKVGVFPSVVVEVLSNSGTPNLHDITPVNSVDPTSLPPPPDSPPPLPPNYPPPRISPEDLGIGAVGPGPVVVGDTSPIPIPNQHLSSRPPRITSSPVNSSSSSSLTPTVTVERPTPDPDADANHTWNADSFDDYDDDESVV